MLKLSKVRNKLTYIWISIYDIETLIQEFNESVDKIFILYFG